MAYQRIGPWSQEEDAYLMQLVNDQGPLNWVRIAQALETRTPKQCRERFHQNLKPTLNHEPITPEEGAQIELLVNEIGKRWAEIARHLHGRSDNAIKNWWNGRQNRHKRHGRRGANKGISGYNDRRYGYFTFQRAALATNPQVASLPFPNHEPPLPSPKSISLPGNNTLDGEASTMSDIASSYTTSPQCLSRGTLPSIQLAPLHMDDNLAPQSLPPFSSLLYASSERKEVGHIRLPSHPQSLLNALKSPVGTGVSYALPPPSPSAADRDSRMDVSALLG